MKRHLQTLGWLFLLVLSILGIAGTLILAGYFHFREQAAIDHIINLP